MVVIYGSREYVKPLDNHPGATCPHCGYHTQMSLTHVYRRATLYYIPLFAVNRKVYAQCPHCGGYSEVTGNSATQARKGQTDHLEAQDMKAVGTNALDTTPVGDDAFGADGVAGADVKSGTSVTPGTYGTADDFGAAGPVAADGTYGDAVTPAAPPVRAPWEKPVVEKKPGDGFRSAGALAIVFAVILAICSVTGIYGASQRASRTYTPLNDLLTSGKALTIGTYVTVDIDAVIGNYASETGSNAREYYMIWLDDNTMMSLETSNRSDIAVLNRLEDDTWAYLNEEQSGLSGEMLSVKGVLRATDRMNSKLRSYYGDMAEALGMEVGDGTVRPWHIECIYDSDPNTTNMTNMVLVALTVLCVVLAVVFFAMAKKKQAAADCRP